MKTINILTFVGLCLPMLGQAGAIASGGTSASPRALIIQEYVPKGGVANETLAIIVEEKMGQDALAHNVAAYFQVTDTLPKGKARTRFCIEYKSTELRDEAKQELQVTLDDNGVKTQLTNPVEILEGRSCSKK